ncbi:MAG: hypothetical protein ACPG5P_08465, partial [Saprospiraceae bacterium]
MSAGSTFREVKEEKKNKRRGRIFAIIFGCVIVALAFIPFSKIEQEKEPMAIQIALDYYEPEPIPEPEVEEVPFEESGSSEPNDPLGDTEEAMEQEAAPVETPDPEPVPDPVPEPTPEPEPVAAPEPTPEPTPAPEATPVATQPEPSPVSAPKPDPKPVETPKPKPRPTRPSRPNIPNDKPTSSAPKPTKPSNGTGSTTSTDNGTKPGTPGKPTGTDNSTSSGNNGSGGTDTGTGSGTGSGHGFSRKVKDRPSQYEIKAIAQNKKGKVHVDVCINQFGKVVSANSNKAKSSLKDDAILFRAENLAKRYRFEKDLKAPAKQCWYLVFNFKD